MKLNKLNFRALTKLRESIFSTICRHEKFLTAGPPKTPRRTACLYPPHEILDKKNIEAHRIHVKLLTHPPRVKVKFNFKVFVMVSTLFFTLYIARQKKLFK